MLRELLQDTTALHAKLWSLVPETVDAFLAQMLEEDVNMGDILETLGDDEKDNDLWMHIQLLFSPYRDADLLAYELPHQPPLAARSITQGLWSDAEGARIYPERPAGDALVRAAKAGVLGVPLEDPSLDLYDLVMTGDHAHVRLAVTLRQDAD